jgi:GHH signature containing HNH/Endo VII superfamily nuclease toxin  2
MAKGSGKGTGKAAGGSKSAGKPAASQKGTPNTGKYPYIDTFNKSTLCNKDRGDIETACKSEQGKKDSKDAKNKAKPNSKLGKAFDKVKGAVGAMDKGAKKTTGYGAKEKADPATSWMEDHCDGLWVKPNGPGSMEKFSEQLEGLKKQLNQDCYDIAKNAGMKVGEMAGDAAINYGEKAVIRQGASLASLVVPFAGEAIVGGVAVWNVVDGVWTAGETVVNAGQQAINATKEILELRDQVGKINDLLSGKMSPTEIFEETMTAFAEVNPCLRARKCQLVPFNKTETAAEQAQKGQGCCPGQTGHHIIPDAAAKGAGCEGYTKGSAPVICLEGASNNHGSHGMAHQTLKGFADIYNGGKNKPPKDISYEQMRNESLKSIKHSTSPQCSQECLQAQMDSYYKECGAMKANPGTGGSTPKQDGTANIE